MLPEFAESELEETSLWVLLGDTDKLVLATLLDTYTAPVVSVELEEIVSLVGGVVVVIVVGVMLGMVVGVSVGSGVGTLVGIPVGVAMDQQKNHQTKKNL